jgi:hypothetical protein
MPVARSLNVPDKDVTQCYNYSTGLLLFLYVLNLKPLRFGSSFYFRPQMTVRPPSRTGLFLGLELNFGGMPLLKSL